MNDKITFSIIICTYNVANKLPKTLNSILDQEFNDFEVIIIDGDSKDKTIDVIKKYEKKFKGKLKWISEKDSGIYEAMNKGIKIAEGGYLNIIGAGDWLEKNALKSAYRCIINNPKSKAVYGFTRIWDENLNKNFEIQTTPEMLTFQPMQHPALFYKKDLHDKYGLYDESYEIVSDYLFCMKAFFFGKSDISLFKEVVDNFVMDGKSSKEKDKCESENLRVKIETGIIENDTLINKDVDVFVISFNRLNYLEKIIKWLEDSGFEKINIIDNNSTYPPLIKYLDSSKHNVFRMNKNFGHLVVWECGMFDNILKNNYYIVSDCDILPIDECPHDVSNFFYQILKKFKNITKVGFSLKIDDIPNHFIYRDNVLDWEIKFWNKQIGNGLFYAAIDTTFALYRPGIYPSDKKWWESIRTYYPYTARHLPWYANSLLTNEEDSYYQKQINKTSSFWSLTDINLLKDYNLVLLTELNEIYSSFRWSFLRVLYSILYFIIRQNYFLNKFRQKNYFLIDKRDPVDLQKNNIQLFEEISKIKKSREWLLIDRISNKTPFFIKKFLKLSKKSLVVIKNEGIKSFWYKVKNKLKQ